MPITFGSVGDIISVSLLVKDVLVSLDDGRGSVAEYQEVIRELYILDRALLQVSQLSRQHEATPELASLCHVAGKAVRDCQHSVETFLRSIEKYRATLRVGSSSSMFSRAARKLQFAVDKKDLSRFRAEIVAHSGSLNMLLAVASFKMVTVSEENIKNQVESSFSSTNSILHKHDATLHDIQDRLTENNQLIGTSNTTLTAIAERLQWVRDLSTGLKNMMNNIFFINIATYRSVLSLQSRLPDPAERTMAQFQEPIIFEDAIGRIAPVHVQFVTTWEMFDSVLEMRFEGAPGIGKIKRKEYALEDQATHQDVDRKRKFDVSFLPGQRVRMSMIFRTVDLVGGIMTNRYATCPRCHVSSEAISAELDVHCEYCGIVYRHTTSAPRSPSLRDDTPSTLNRKRSREDVPNIDRSDLAKFKRVRVVSDPATPVWRRKLDSAGEWSKLYKELFPDKESHFKTPYDEVNFALPPLNHSNEEMKTWGSLQLDELFKLEITPSTSAMAIPRVWEDVPPPLPPPRHIGELSEGQDPGWKWGSTNNSSEKTPTSASDRAPFSRIGGPNTPTWTMPSSNEPESSTSRLSGSLQPLSIPNWRHGDRWFTPGPDPWN